MNRRELLQQSATLSAVALGSMALGGESRAASGAQKAEADRTASQAAPAGKRLNPPAHGITAVAFLISEGAVMIDFAGPWEVFQDVHLPGRSGSPFSLYTVAETLQPIRASGGMRITPDYTIANAPAPNIIVIPAQASPSEQVKEWIRHATRTTDVTMSVCDGASVLASTGLLSGKAATAHHGSYVDLQNAYPDIQVKRGVRFVEVGNLASSGGLSAGIDLALHVVERYYGRDVARSTAFNMEYQGEGWMNPSSAAVYAHPPVQTGGNPLCPVCWMDADRAIKSDYEGKTYFFCSSAHKQIFDRDADQFTKS